MSYIILLAIYTVVILAFVPLDKIAKAQTTTKAQIKKIKDKITK